MVEGRGRNKKGRRKKGMKGVGKEHSLKLGLIELRRVTAKGILYAAQAYNDLQYDNMYVHCTVYTRRHSAVSQKWIIEERQGQKVVLSFTVLFFYAHSILYYHALQT